MGHTKPHIARSTLVQLAGKLGAVKTRIPRDVATARRPGRPIPAAIGTAGWAQAETDRARIRTVLRAPSDWRAPAPVPRLSALKVGAVNDPLEHVPACGKSFSGPYRDGRC